MRSNEVAKLAGVTVRTLRHYHQLGLLAEPERSENGYRDYAATDVALRAHPAHAARRGHPSRRLPR